MPFRCLEKSEEKNLHQIDGNFSGDFHLHMAEQITFNKKTAQVYI